MRETEENKSNKNSKLFICSDEKYSGKGESLNLAYENYLEFGSKSFINCTFYNASEIIVELKIK